MTEFMQSPNGGSSLELSDSVAAIQTTSVASAVAPPYEQFPDLFHVVAVNRHELGVSDSKLLADADLTASPEEVAALLAAEQPLTPAKAYEIWQRSTQLPDYANRLAQTVQPNTGMTLDQYIRGKWSDLTYHQPQDAGTLIATQEPHLKSGVRYKEGYYWDIADGLEGLILEAQTETDPAKWKLIFGVLHNFARTIERFGFIPNGMRTYYLSRSQPPKFAEMVKMVAAHYPEAVEEFLPAVVREYNWWTKGERDVDAGKGVYASDHVFLMPDGSHLGRYWDTRDDPRPEGRYEDIRAAERNPHVPAPLVFRRQRIMAASGRDFTGQYMEDPERIETAYPDRIAPVDLNSLLWGYEDFIAEAHEKAGRSVLAREFAERRDRRAAAINKYLWSGDETSGYYSDFLFDDDFRQGAPTGISSMTMAYAASRKLSPPHRAEASCRQLVMHHLKRWGYIATLLDVEHQWDSNAWAPDQNEADKALARVAGLQGDAVGALRSFLQVNRATWQHWRRVGRARWVGAHARIFREQGKIVEKNRASGPDPSEVRNGEYAMDDGFLWTNGVLRRFMSTQVESPVLEVVRCVPSDLLHLPR